MSINLNKTRQDKSLLTSSNSTFLTNYTFKPEVNTVEIGEKYNVIQYIVNLTLGKLIYNPLDVRLKGKDEGTRVIMDFDTTGMAPTDQLVISAEVKDITREQMYSKVLDLEDELKAVNIILNEAIN